MEFLIYVLIALLLLGLFMKFRKDRVPDNIKHDFKRRFPDAKNCDWGHPKDYYEVVFYHKGKEKKVKYDESGYWIETKTAIFSSDIPENVQGILDSKFTTYNLDDVSLVTNNRGQKFYKLITDTGEVNYLLKVDDSGKLLQIRDLTTDKLKKTFNKDAENKEIL